MNPRTWSEEQEDIFKEFSTGRSHFVVEARAGTGKTTTCNEGISRARELKKCYVAFNRKNVNEAKEKIKDPRCQVKSLNGLGYSYVLQNWKGVKPEDDVEYDRIRSCAAAAFRGRQYVPTVAIKELVSYAKNTNPFAKFRGLLEIAVARNIGPEDYQEKAGWTIQDICRVAEAAMLLAQQPDPKGRISFNDQLWLPIVKGWVRPWFELLVVDEAQDLNDVQLKMIEKAVKPAGRLVLVGDTRQAIYGFRGASSAGFQQLKDKLHAKTLPLTTTYRCPKLVVELAQKLVPDYKVAPTAPEGIIRRVSRDGFEKSLVGGDAVLSRVNAPLLPVCLALLKRGQRAYIEGRDIGRQLQGVHEKLPSSDIKSYLNGLDEWAAKKIERVQGEPGSDTYEANIQAIVDQTEVLKTLATADDTRSPADVGAKLNVLFVDSDQDKNPVKPVVCSSIHRAKGLEWSRCHLITDSFRKTTWTPRVSEEQNILYVAITRTKNELVWVDQQLQSEETLAAEAQKRLDAQPA